MVKKKLPKVTTLKGIEKIFKPKLIVHICYALTLSGPYLNLLLNAGEKNYDRLFLLVIFTGITLPLFTLNWVWYIYELKHYKINAKILYEDIIKCENTGYLE